VDDTLLVFNMKSGNSATAVVESWEKGIPPAATSAGGYGLADESEEKLQYAFRMILEVYRGRASTNENEIRALRQSIEELRITNTNLTKKLQSAEREIMEQQHRNQVLVKDNENLAIANRQLLQRCEKYKRIQQTFSEALENSGHDEDIPLAAFSATSATGSYSSSTGAPSGPTNSSSGEFRSAYAGLGSVSLSPKGGSMLGTTSTFTTSAGPSSASASAVPSASMTGASSAAPTSNNGGGSSGFDSNGKDGKQFFRVVRTRLPFESFNAFLTVIKKLNSHEYTRDVAVEEAKKIFGPENSDLLGDFQALISRHISAAPST
jgi:hypothetical protein